MSTTDDGQDIDDLRTDLIIGVSVLGAVCGILLIAVIALFIWNFQLSKKIKKLDPFVNFKLQRPRMFKEESLAPRQPQPYDNPGFVRTPFNQHEQQRSLNPIAHRNTESVDNGNFSFGNPNREMNSFKGPDYMDRDSRFY